MKNLLEYLEKVEDNRQKKKVKHKMGDIKMGDIIAIVFFATLANANEWIEIYLFAMAHETFLHEYLELPNGIPSHDTTAIPCFI